MDQYRHPEDPRKRELYTSDLAGRLSEITGAIVGFTIVAFVCMVAVGALITGLVMMIEWIAR